MHQLARIYSDKAFLAIAPLLATTAGTHIAIQTLWAGPWLRDVAGLDRTGVANYLFAMGVAFLAGILGSGAIADWFIRRGASELAVMAGFLVLFLIAQIGIVLEVTSYGLLFWLIFGMSGQVAILAYPWLSARFGAELSGRANTAMNLLIFLAAFGIQYGIGAIIALFPPQASGGFDPRSYQAAFAVFLGLQVVTFAMFVANRRLFRSAAPRALPANVEIDVGRAHLHPPLVGVHLYVGVGSRDGHLAAVLADIDGGVRRLHVHVAAGINLGARSGGRRSAILLVGDQLNAIGRRRLDKRVMVAAARKERLA